MNNTKQYLDYGIDKDIAESYAARLNNHIAEVRKAGEKFNVPTEQLLIHDESKWSKEEFPAYALKFFGEESSPLIDANFNEAWLLHIRNNEHHWERWVVPSLNIELDKSVIEMPENYALEMLADWVGAGVAYKGEDNLVDWLDKNSRGIVLHPNTARFVNDSLLRNKYRSVLHWRNGGRFVFYGSVY